MATDPIFDTQWEHIIVSRNGPIVEVMMNRPEAKNGLNVPLIADLADFANKARRRSDIQVVILTGGAEIFSEGGEYDTIMERIGAPTAMKRRENVIQGGDMAEAWHNIEAITIAAIEGRCRGGGCALALTCDFRVISENTQMFLPEVPLGLSMGWGTIPRIVALLGPARAKRYVLLGEILKPVDCVDWGLADMATPAGGSLEMARQLAKRITALPPVPARMAKASINAAAYALHATTTYTDRDQYLLTAASKDFTEGVTALVEEREPKFVGD